MILRGISTITNRRNLYPALDSDNARHHELGRLMLALDDPRWTELWHSYGSGENVPPFLRKIERASKELPSKFWDEFGNILCHQCSTGSASVAAFPHLVRLADLNCGSENGFHALVLAAEILAFELGESGQLERVWKRSLQPPPEYIRQPFRDAIKAGQHLIAKQLFKRRYSFSRMTEWLAITAAFSRHADMFLLLPQLRRRSFMCPNCEADIDTSQMYTF